MRILVYEFVTGGGLAGRVVPPSLVREGGAMRETLVGDLAAIGAHSILTTSDPRIPFESPPGVETITLPVDGDRRLEELIAEVDAVWVVAPETRGCLEGLAARVERAGKTLLGSGSEAIRRAADKEGLADLLAAADAPYPKTRVAMSGAGGYPVVVKPRRGAGSEGVRLARDAEEFRIGVEKAGPVGGRDGVLMQEFVSGAAVSVSLLTSGGRSAVLAVNTQHLESFAYQGGTTPSDHPLAPLAAETARRACEAIGGLRGYVGVDLILTDTEAVVIEVNPRLTTSYLGVRAAIEENAAALVLDACAGNLPASVPLSRRVRFNAAGAIVSSTPLPAGESRPVPVS